MKKFLFGIHCHQPIGNFEYVVRTAIDDCYRPFIKSLHDHPGVKAVVHLSGCLFDFFEQYAPDLMDCLNDLTDRRQIDILGGGYYEPILPLWPERDQKAQLLKMKAYAQEKFGQDPQGMWLAERVWEPQLPFVIREAGYRATFLDDAHFLAAGLIQRQIHGYFITEDRGKKIAIFPINKPLRYMIPFKPVPVIEEFFRSHNEELLTMVDDGEKFGVWPGTAQWVYRDGWLEAFFSFLEKRGEVETIGLEEALSLKDRGFIYIPTASYEEMEEWTLPPARQADFRRLKAAMSDERSQGLVRGGFFRNYFAKYEESRRLYHRLLSLGDRIESSSALYDDYLKAQCNCAYWHGIFGGLYLPHLRHALWKQMIHVDRKLGETGTGKIVESERFVRNEKIQIFLSDEGTIQEIDDFRSGSNLVNTLRRRLEGYHLSAGEEKASTGQASSIHEEVRRVPEECAGYLLNDEHPRDVLRDHFLKTFDEEQTVATAMVIGEPIPCNKDVQQANGNFTVALEGEGFSLFKKVMLGADRIIARYVWGERASGIHHIISSDLFILDGYYQPAGSLEKRSLDEPWKGNCASVVIRDAVEKIDVTYLYPESLLTCVVPVKTVSISESGYNCIRQSMAIFVQTLARNDFEVHIIIGG